MLGLAPVAASAQDVVVKRFVGGSGVNAVGIVDASEDVEINGPQALTTGENGELFLLDQVNNRIVRFDPKKPAPTRAFSGCPRTCSRPTWSCARTTSWSGTERSVRCRRRRPDRTTRPIAGWRK